MKGLVERGNRYNGHGKGRFYYIDIPVSLKKMPFCHHFKQETNMSARSKETVSLLK